MRSRAQLTFKERLDKVTKKTAKALWSCRCVVQRTYELKSKPKMNIRFIPTFLGGRVAYSMLKAQKHRTQPRQFCNCSSNWSRAHHSIMYWLQSYQYFDQQQAVQRILWSRILCPRVINYCFVSWRYTNLEWITAYQSKKGNDETGPLAKPKVKNAY